MPYLSNPNDHDLEVPSLGVVIPAGGAVQIEGGEQFADHPLLKLTKTKPANTNVVADDSEEN